MVSAAGHPPCSARAEPGRPIEPEVPGPFAAAAAGLFGALSSLRGGRIFHPDGVGYSGTLRVGGPVEGCDGVPLLSRAGEYAAVVRFSRGGGLPEPLPDVLGLALRLVDVHGPGRHQDFLLATSGRAPVLDHLLLPGIGGFFGQPFSSILPYRIGDMLRMIGALPTSLRARRGTSRLRELTEAADRGEVRYSLALAPLTGRWSPVAELAVDERLPDRDTERLAFTPWNSGGGIRPAGPFMGLRQPAYRGSQRGRGLRGREIP
jgi:hypothetical protein